MGLPMEREVAECFGGNVLAARKRVGLTQAELARRSTLHPTYIGYIERGMRTPCLDTVLRLAGSLGVGVEELVRGIEWSPPPPPPSPPWCGFTVRPAA